MTDPTETCVFLKITDPDEVKNLKFDHKEMMVNDSVKFLLKEDFDKFVEHFATESEIENQVIAFDSPTEGRSNRLGSEFEMLNQTSSEVQVSDFEYIYEVKLRTLKTFAKLYDGHLALKKVDSGRGLQWML